MTSTVTGIISQVSKGTTKTGKEYDFVMLKDGVGYEKKYLSFKSGVLTGLQVGQAVCLTLWERDGKVTDMVDLVAPATQAAAQAAVTPKTPSREGKIELLACVKAAASAHSVVITKDHVEVADSIMTLAHLLLVAVNKEAE